MSGSLLSHDAIEELLRFGEGNGLRADTGVGALREEFRAWHRSVRERLGPCCSPRAVFDLVAEPLGRALGYRVIPLSGSQATVDALLESGGLASAVLVATSWSEGSAGVWRHGVHRGLSVGVRWCLCVSGAAVRVIDAERPYSRRYVEFALHAAVDDDRSLSVLWGLVSAGASGERGLPVLERTIASCERHRKAVGVSLRDGVREALVGLVGAFRAASRSGTDPPLLAESLIVVYRILFLLFAEARSLVPHWHPVYREGYTVESLGRVIEQGRGHEGTWEALQAIARLAHRGCRAGTLRVPPFNGRLFSPTDAPLADRLPLDDGVVSEAVMALMTRVSGEGRRRISYADLGVEQLGAVYEQLLDYDLAGGRRAGPDVLVPTGRRKATGSFYTPRSLTEFVVRRTLAPLVRDATPEQVLSLRVLDPAMGSGAFLVAACRYLAGAYEQAILREGALTPGDIGDGDRAAFRRVVSQRCLFGVDVNPMAVQLGRLSLWLATLAGDKPLTFLDHHLRVGNSLVGGSIEDIARQPAPGRGAEPLRELPLFAWEGFEASIESVVRARTSIVETPDDTIEQVRGKEKALAALERGGPLENWKQAADLWCAAWFGERRQVPGRAAFQALLDVVLGRGGALPAQVAGPFVDRARAYAASERFFHWPLEFPEVFYEGGERTSATGGFDAVVGNPPWEMLREDGDGARWQGLAAFARGSRVYSLQGRGHGNLYQLFLERSMGLLRPGGRAGLILPAGFGSDLGCARLRRELFERATVDTFTTLENRDGVFPVHRGLKFLLMTFVNGGATTELRMQAPVRSAHLLEREPDTGEGPGTEPIVLPRALIDRLSGPSLAVPELRAAADLEIVSDIVFRIPGTADPEGWGIRFGRELNATDDRPHFTESRGLPVVEGKHLAAFSVDVRGARYRLPARVAATLLDEERTFGRIRLAYRDVASPTNRATLIAAILPKGVVSTHTVSCLKDMLDEEAQFFLCGVFNSYVANYLVRMRVGTHVTSAIMSRLPVPRPGRRDVVFGRVVSAARALSERFDAGLFARLNATVAALYGLSRERFAHVLGTFPIVAAAERAAALGFASREYDAAGGRLA
jgi:hypothetical protein